ncbi:hypothetical protein H4R34_000607 [Dimargaris verticillata]|uniref:Uncharacterized protein n=1 Tax=Dimargaris verticillata TaxID=2761393 RepID=A0A9W8EF86_9FUNG|nr:hypothetical protein H4R34_000607 [Dimargaris verticillata]
MDVTTQLAKYEKFVEERLQPDLAGLLSERDVLYEKLSEYSKLRLNIEQLDKHGLQSLKTQVDLGANFYIQAKVPNVEYIYVNVGYGFHLQLSHSEALAYIDKKELQLQKRTTQLTDEANRIKAQIKTVYMAVAELLQMSGGTAVTAKSSR